MQETCVFQSLGIKLLLLVFKAELINFYEYVEKVDTLDIQLSHFYIYQIDWRAIWFCF